jgi:hypothetical protein
MRLRLKRICRETFDKVSPFLIIIYICSLIGFMNITVLAQNDEITTNPFEDFNPDNFNDPTNINNEWLPLKPGMQYVYEGTTVDEGEVLEHRVIITVTDLTKIINNIPTVITWDLDYSDGELVEAELAFYAQDDDGNVWRMGEYPEEYEDGNFIGADCWISGIEGSVAGISMLSKPFVGAPSYSQGWAPSVDFTDRGKVDQIGIKNCVPVDCYEDVLVITETSISEPDAEQLKYFARGVGNIRVGWRGEGEQTQENLELVELSELVLYGMDEARSAALELEKHAYEVGNEIYSKTEPIKHNSEK